MTARFPAEFYAAMLQRLMPPGLAWPRDDDSVQTEILRRMALRYERSDAAAVKLLADAFPATADALLPEWEATLGLPDPCAGDNPSYQTRLNQVVARFSDQGGASAAYYIAFAAQLGFAITITNDRPFRVGDACELPAKGDAWAHTWTVNADDQVLSLFRAGTSCEQPLADLTLSAVLECELEARQQAHTVLLFNYA